ncbi:centriolar coiled-coil protein of 110 kDa [Chanos chanos]|uniref:Centriolar coiled-coil protein of 110 kDa n=1 Tax=Chanos chanos TaxID=29144 RepID=A0A6J2VFP7_CHACN|nr:centriolar coiled-coil protein of 110 kDa-like [Chanos chanos]
MEGYEDFCSRSLERLQQERKLMFTQQSTCKQALSTFRFNGRHLLLPMLSEQQRVEMAELRRCSAQREAEWRQDRSSSLLARVQHILDRVQMQKAQNAKEVPASLPVYPSLLPDSRPGHSPDLLPINMDTPHNGQESEQGSCSSRCKISSSSKALRRETLKLLNRRLANMDVCVEDLEEDKAFPSNVLESHTTTDEEHRHTTLVNTHLSGENLSDKENESTGGLIGECWNPITSADHGKHLVQPGSPDCLLGSLSLSLTGSYARLPSPQRCRSPLARPSQSRAIPPGNILISSPLSELELSPERSSPLSDRLKHVSRERPKNVGGAEIQEESSMLPPTAKEWNCSQSELNSTMLTSVRTSTPSGAHSLTSKYSQAPSRQISPTQSDGCPQSSPASHAPSTRSPPAPLNKSYDVESPSPTLLRPHIYTEPWPGQVKRRLDLGETQGSDKDRLTLEELSCSDQVHNTSAEVQRQIQALEEMRQCLDREHAHQLSQLLTEQEKEQQRLHQELRSRMSMCKGQGNSVSSPLKPNGRSPTHMTPGVPSARPVLIPTVQSNKTQSSKACIRHYQVLSVRQQLALCRLSAIARGYLTRRLLNTEKVKHLRKTVQDTKEFLRSLQRDSVQKSGSMSCQDATLQHRVAAQVAQESHRAGHHVTTRTP